jgi:hypothetical protein
MLINKDKREESMYRIVRCCGNCYYSSYFKGKQRRLVCLHGIKPDPRPKGRPSKKSKTTIKTMPKFYKKDMYDKFPRTHATAVCDLHKWSSKKFSIIEVRKWCKADYLGDDY